MTTYGTRSLASQPRSNTLEVKLVTAWARQLNHKTVFIFQVGNPADSTVVVFLEGLAIHTIDRVEKFLRNACQSSRRIVDVALEVNDKGLEKIAIVVCRGGHLKLMQLFLEKSEESGCVYGSRCRVRVVMRGLGA
ncbi:hypothetical protein FGSG_13328 [Fusarium graminearum PH-1]|uniref:hypothetical protein n=1 Tax=Gibberella zeae (strain ATCC MYA-4620 / CBS 123657 / FGSC 9075 / NRRL 31084 / PH-1) TaxID=229533 RepID=UPI00021F1D24|nr:hypothetical protein FGSG_13328 [Fusarium graminearum PH-1]ESU14690.1 hypothetical protein FGSG_13328 [Fusarium graminearum PH-1]|eukprot:XP_011320115.1 hypothetical protein FGSG_13328 [Fusarium graminearum PH-1]